MRIAISALLVSFAVTFGQDVNMLSNSSAHSELLHVENTGNDYKVLVSATTTSSNGGQGVTVGYNGTASGWTGIGNGIYMGNYGSAYGYSAGIQIGNDGYSEGITHNSWVGNGGYHYGVRTSVAAGDWATTYGTYSISNAGIGSTVYGVYASGYAYEDAYVYGVYGSAYVDYNPYMVAAGYFDGKLYYGSLHAISDQKFKKNVRDLPSGLEKILALKPRLYEMKVDEFKGKLNLDGGEKIGFVAQELETVLPQLVSDAAAPAHLTEEERKNKVKKDPTKYKAVDYTGVIPVLVKAIQEQQAQIESMRSEIASLKAR